VDFDAMSHDMHRPPPCSHNIHFMCWADWAGRSAGVSCLADPCSCKHPFISRCILEHRTNASGNVNAPNTQRRGLWAASTAV